MNLLRRPVVRLNYLTRKMFETKPFIKIQYFKIKTQNYKKKTVYCELYGSSVNGRSLPTRRLV